MAGEVEHIPADLGALRFVLGLRGKHRPRGAAPERNRRVGILVGDRRAEEAEFRYRSTNFCPATVELSESTVCAREQEAAAFGKTLVGVEARVRVEVLRDLAWVLILALGRTASSVVAVLVRRDAMALGQEISPGFDKLAHRGHERNTRRVAS